MPKLDEREREYLKLVWSIDKVDEEVGGFNETANSINANDHVSIGFKVGVVKQQRSTEK